MLFASRWDRMRLLITPGRIRAGLVLLSLAAMVIGGSAGQRWD